MRIGIVTPYDSANFGAYLQAYANMKYLESMGHSVFFVKFRSESQRKKIFFPSGNSAMSKIVNLLRRKYSEDNYLIMSKALDIFTVVELQNLSDAKLDAVIVGSDEIWNVKVKTFQNPVFYGIENIPSFAYAPSIGNASRTDFMQYDYLINKIKKICVIGVRDQNTQYLLASFYKEKPPIVCDPTCLLDPNQYPINGKRLIREKYILVYSYSVPLEFQKILKKYARQRGLKLVSVCMYQRWCDKNVICKPLEFCSLIQYAECVFTTTFHGTIFTIMQHKKCVIYAASQKLKDLLEWTNMQSVSINLNETYEHIKFLLDNTPDYSEYEIRMKNRRNISRERYKSCLEELL